MALARKIAYNVVVNTAAKALSTAVALVGIGLMTRYLGPEGFGNYATVLAFFAFFMAIADFGLHTVAAREISREGADEKYIMGNVFTLRLIISTGFLLIFPLLVTVLPYTPEVKTGLLLISAAFFFSSNYVVLNGIFQKNVAMDRVSITELLGKIVQVSVIIYAVKNDLGFVPIIASVLAAMVFDFVVVFLLSRRFLKFRLRVDKAFWKKFLKQSLPMGASALIVFLYFKVDTILLSVLQTSEDVGIYNGAYKIVETLVFFPSMMMGLILPLMSRYIFSDKEKFTQISNKVFKFFLIVATPIVIGVLFIAEEIMLIIGGEEFLVSANVLRILIFAYAGIFFGQFYFNMLLAGNLQKLLFAATAAAAVFNITTNLIVIPTHSYWGAATVSVSTELLVALIAGVLAWKFLSYKPSLDKVLGIVLGALVMAVTLYVVDGIHILISIGAGGVAYVASLWITKTITKEELLLVLGKKDDLQPNPNHLSPHPPE